jgi:cellulose synthase (UDP-forming)
MTFESVALSLFVLGFCLLVLPFLDRYKTTPRYFVFVLVFILTVYYYTWRIFYTLLPAPLTTGQGLWIWFCFLIEVFMLLESLVFYIIMSKFTNRLKEADRYEKILRSLPQKNLPVVDVFLPTYNEPIEVLERSILGCLALEWPEDKLNVWVLDDGKRDWLKEFCEERGVGYIRRVTGKHAKAGNINNAFEFTKAEYIAIFDADFVPFKKFLYRTIGFFLDPKVAILQTPQHFFNKDYLQSNLHLQNSAMDDQRLFFDVMMPARDGWDAAFWCGSCSVSRRAAMKDVGGVPTSSITEDLLTTLVLLRKGYVTRYLNEKLSHGLAPESLEALSTQRKRWCRGTIQTLYSKDGPVGPGLNFIHRILFFPLHWILTPITVIMSFIVPLVFLWTGVSAIIIEHYSQLIAYQVPLLILDSFVVQWLVPRNYVPFLNSAVNAVNAIHVLPSMIHSLIKPHAKEIKFGVTPKGSTNRKAGFHRFTFWISFTLFLLTVGGIFINLFPEIQPVRDNGFFPVAAFWATLNAILLGIMCLISFEHPRMRVDERFTAHDKRKAFINSQETTIQMHDISLGGLSFTLTEDISVTPGTEFSIFFEDVGDVKAQAIFCNKRQVKAKFIHLEGEQRELMIQHIYTGTYDDRLIRTPQNKLWKELFRRAFGMHEHLYKRK